MAPNHTVKNKSMFQQHAREGHIFPLLYIRIPIEVDEGVLHKNQWQIMLLNERGNYNYNTAGSITIVKAEQSYPLSLYKDLIA